jgi:flagellar basal body-associated protein FliL
MKKHKNLIIGLLVIGAVGYFVWHSSKAKAAATTTPSITFDFAADTLA